MGILKNKHLKLFSVLDPADAVKLGAARFSCAPEEVFVSVLEESLVTPAGAEEPVPEYLVLTAFAGEGGVQPAFIDADINLLYEQDGVYLEAYPPVGGGRPLKVDETAEYLNRKALSQVDMETALKHISNAGGTGVRVKIAPPQEENRLDEDIAAWYSKDEMEGYMRFLQPDEGGEKLTVARISDKLTRSGIVFGVSPISLGEASRERNYGKHYTIAKGTCVRSKPDGTRRSKSRKKLRQALHNCQGDIARKRRGW